MQKDKRDEIGRAAREAANYNYHNGLTYDRNNDWLEWPRDQDYDILNVLLDREAVCEELTVFDYAYRTELRSIKAEEG